MADVIFVAVICAFFALCVVYVRWCDRIIGAEVTSPTGGGVEPDANLDAPTVGASA